MAQKYELAWLDADIDGEPAVPAVDQQVEYQRYLKRLELVMVESRPSYCFARSSTPASLAQGMAESHQICCFGGN
jgi:hypothetical protein